MAKQEALAVEEVENKTEPEVTVAEKSLVVLDYRPKKQIDETISTAEKYVSRYHYDTRHIDAEMELCPHCQKPTFSAFQKVVVDRKRHPGRCARWGTGGSRELPISDGMIRTGLALHGIWHWNLGDAPDMMRMIGRVGPKLDTMITHRFPLDRIEEAWKLQMTGQCGKVVIVP